MVNSDLNSSQGHSKNFGKTIDGLLVWFAIAIYALGYLSIAFNDQVEGAQYLHYLVPLILASSLLLKPNPQVRISFALFLCLFGILIPVSLILGWGGDTRWSANAVLLFLILMLFVPSLQIRMSHVKTLFLCTFFLFLVAFAFGDHDGVRLFNLLTGETASAVGNEYNSEESLIGPLYALYFFFQGSPIFGCLAALMTVVGGKRIGLLALVAGISLLLIAARMPIFRERIWRFLLLVTVLSVIGTLSINIIPLAEFLHSHFRISVSLEEVMLGRHNTGLEFIRQFESRSLWEALVGSGPGAADDLTMTVSTLVLPHNDWVKLLYDYGFVGLVLTIALFSYICSASFVGVGMGVAMAVLMVTDNVLIYIFFHIPLAFVLNALENADAK